MKEYKIGRNIQRLDGTIPYTVEEIVDYIYGNPVTKIIFSGTKEECERKLKEMKGE